jgi:hypothetical protein
MKQIRMCGFFVMIVICVFVISVQAATTPKTFQVCLDRTGGNHLASGDATNAAKYDMAIFNRFVSTDLSGGTWTAIKQLNPNILIYIYNTGIETEGPNCDYDNSVCRYSTFNSTYPSLFLTNGGNRITDPDYTDFWLMDFGSTGTNSYPNLWAQYTKIDIVNNSSVVADGIFGDRCDLLATFKTDKYGGIDIGNGGSVSNAAWITAANYFANTISGLMAPQKLFLNRGGTRFSNGSSGWTALDGMSTPPDAVLEEGAFVVRYGAPSPGAWFFSEDQWKLQIDLMSQIHHSKTVWESHCNMTETQTGTDQDGNSVGFWDAYWYAITSYLIGKNTTDNNSYFAWMEDVNAVLWQNELSTINLGNPIGSYISTKIGSVNIYSRKYANGTVYVNPGTSSATITLSSPGMQLSHSNFTTGVQVSSFTLAPKRGTIVMTAGTSPSPPANIRIVP